MVARAREVACAEGRALSWAGDDVWAGTLEVLLDDDADPDDPAWQAALGEAGTGAVLPFALVKG